MPRAKFINKTETPKFKMTVKQVYNATNNDFSFRKESAIFPRYEQIINLSIFVLNKTTHKPLPQRNCNSCLIPTQKRRGAILNFLYVEKEREKRTTSRFHPRSKTTETSERPSIEIDVNELILWTEFSSIAASNNQQSHNDGYEATSNRRPIRSSAESRDRYIQLHGLSQFRVSTQTT